MKLARLVALLCAAISWQAAAQTWDTSGNGMLNGTYYFREVIYVTSTGALSRAIALYGNISFNGSGTYSINCLVMDSSYGAQQTYTTSGTYSIAASGYGFLSSPISSGASIYGLVSQQGIFVGSTTESGFNDLFIAAGDASAYECNLQGVLLAGGYGYPEWHQFDVPGESGRRGQPGQRDPHGIR